MRICRCEPFAWISRTCEGARRVTSGLDCAAATSRSDGPSASLPNMLDGGAAAVTPPSAAAASVMTTRGTPREKGWAARPALSSTSVVAGSDAGARRRPRVDCVGRSDADQRSARAPAAAAPARGARASGGWARSGRSGRSATSRWSSSGRSAIASCAPEAVRRPALATRATSAGEPRR